MFYKDFCFFHTSSLPPFVLALAVTSGVLYFFYIIDFLETFIYYINNSMYVVLHI